MVIWSLVIIWGSGSFLSFCSLRLPSLDFWCFCVVTFGDRPVHFYRSAVRPPLSSLMEKLRCPLRICVCTFGGTEGRSGPSSGLR